MTGSLSHTTATRHAQYMYSSLASLAFSTAALNLHADHLGSAHGRLIASLKALLHAHYHAEAIWCTHCTLAHQVHLGRTMPPCRHFLQAHLSILIDIIGAM
jgi:hypothetical protein